VKIPDNEWMKIIGRFEHIYQTIWTYLSDNLDMDNMKTVFVNYRYVFVKSDIHKTCLIYMWFCFYR